MLGLDGRGRHVGSAQALPDLRQFGQKCRRPPPPSQSLILIQEIDVLPKIYGRVVIPQIVHEELGRASAPELVRSWMDHMPVWLEVRSPLTAPDSLLAKLDA